MDWTYNILGPDPAAGLMVVLILIIIEGVLSVDNAAVLATMVMRLPEHQRGKALKYGIIGAYVFRGLCLALAAWLITSGRAAGANEALATIRLARPQIVLRQEQLLALEQFARNGH